MISIESASMSKRGDNFSNSLVMTANGDTAEAVDDADVAPDAVETRLLKEPWLPRGNVTALDLWSFRHVKARRVIIASWWMMERLRCKESMCRRSGAWTNR